MYQVKVMLEALSQDDNDLFDFDAAVTYRNIHSRDACDFVAATVIKSLFGMSNVKMDVNVKETEVKEK